MDMSKEASKGEHVLLSEHSVSAACEYSVYKVSESGREAMPSLD